MSDDTQVSELEPQEIQDSQIEEELALDPEQDPAEPTEPNGEDPAALKAELERITAEKAELADKNRQLYARLKKQEPKSTPNTPASPTDDYEDIRSTVKQLSLSEQKRQFGFEYGLSPQETDAVFKINPKPTKETLNDPFVRGGLAAIRAKARVANATPSSSSKASIINGKSWSDIAKDQTLSKEDKQKNYQAMMSKFKK